MSTRQAALSLYRRSLRLSLDWAVHRHLWRGQALYIRSLFEANRNITDPRKQRVRHSHFPSPSLVSSHWDFAWAGPCGSHTGDNAELTEHPVHRQALLTETEKLLQEWKHPDPYTPPTAPGGMLRFYAPKASGLEECYANRIHAGSKYERNVPVHSTARKYQSLPVLFRP
ncbi:lyr family protein [Apiospora hydei]|uniref:NADH dehydrogenase [ubiquinone] 1 beta subcomplex subunit 9 n=1 Tax=Apiospora hydei TaxID=1337664 RepID=A0ABR1WR33_9PEZI